MKITGVCMRAFVLDYLEAWLDDQRRRPLQDQSQYVSMVEKAVKSELAQELNTEEACVVMTICGLWAIYQGG